MKKDSSVVYEIPYAWKIRFEGYVTVPVADEENAIYEVNKFLQENIRQFKVWKEPFEYLNPDWQAWSDGPICKCVDENEV